MPISRQTIRRNVARESRLSVYRTGTADSGGTTTTLVDEPLQVSRKNEFAGGFLYPLNGADLGEELLITESDETTGTLTYRPATGAALDSDDYEVLPFRPGDIYDAIDEAMQSLYAERMLGREVVFRGLVTGSPIFNGGFDIGVKGWTYTGTPVTFEAIQQGDSGADADEHAPGAYNYMNFRGEDATSTYMSPSTWAEQWLQQVRGSNCTLRALIKCDVASDVRLNLVANGTNHRSSFHTGGSEWELLETEEVSDISESSPLDIRIEHEGGGGDAFIALVWVETNASDVLLPLPSTQDLSLRQNDIIDISVERRNLNGLENIGDMVHFGRGKPTLWEHLDYDVSNDVVSTLATDMPNTYSGIWVPGGAGRRLYVKAIVPPTAINRTFTAAVNDTDRTLELTPQQGRFVAKIAAFNLMERLITRVPASLAARIEARMAVLNRDIERLRGTFAPSISSDLPWGV